MDRTERDQLFAADEDLRWGKCFGEARWWVLGKQGGIIYVNSLVQARADWYVQWLKPSAAQWLAEQRENAANL